MSISDNRRSEAIKGPPSSFKNGRYDHLFDLVVTRCPNESCHGYIIETIPESGMLNVAKMVYPAYTFRPYPEYIPAHIRQDYQEACAVKDLSPKASATLSRRCLQGMIRDFWGIRKPNLHSEITELRNHSVDGSLVDALLGIKSIGNIGAHPEVDTAQMVDVAPEEAETLIATIELLLAEWYVAREARKVLLEKAAELNRR